MRIAKRIGLLEALGMMAVLLLASCGGEPEEQPSDGAEQEPAHPGQQPRRRLAVGLGTHSRQVRELPVHQVPVPLGPGIKTGHPRPGHRLVDLPGARGRSRRSDITRTMCGRRLPAAMSLLLSGAGIGAIQAAPHTLFRRTGSASREPKPPPPGSLAYYRQVEKAAYPGRPVVCALSRIGCAALRPCLGHGMSRGTVAQTGRRSLQATGSDPRLSGGVGPSGSGSPRVSSPSGAGPPKCF